jgi:hypothetical protein
VPARALRTLAPDAAPRALCARPLEWIELVRR